MAKLTQLFDRFLKSPQGNPVARGADEFSRFIRALAAKGELRTFSEAEWFETGRRFGLDDDQIAGWIEQAASWMGKSPRGLEAAAWTELDTKRNPKERGKGGAEWVIETTDPSEGRSHSVAYSREKAYKEAATTAARLAQDELDAFEWTDEDAERLGNLNDTISEFKKGNFEESYLSWKEYALDADPEEDVTILD